MASNELSPTQSGHQTPNLLSRRMVLRGALAAALLGVGVEAGRYMSGTGKADPAPSSRQAVYATPEAPGTPGNLPGSTATDSHDTVRPKFEMNRLSPEDPMRFAGRENSDPARTLQIIESGAGTEDLRADFRIMAEQVGWPMDGGYLDDAARQRIATAYGELFAAQTEKLLNSCLTNEQVSPYLSGIGNFAEEMSDACDPAEVGGIYGLDGKSVGDSFSQQLDMPLTDDELVAMLPYQMVHGAHYAVLNSYFDAVRSTGDINQSVKVRHIDTQPGIFTDDGGGNVKVTLGVSKVTGSIAGKDQVIHDEIVGTAYLSSYSAEDGVIRSELDGNMLADESSYDIFKKVAESYYGS